jgi:hypothetical protein
MDCSVEYECVFCKETFTRRVAWFDPRMFVGKPHMQITFWCPGPECRLSNTLTIKFNKDKTILVKKIQDTATLLGEQPEESPEITARPRRQ